MITRTPRSQESTSRGCRQCISGSVSFGVRLLGFCRKEVRATTRGSPAWASRGAASPTKPFAATHEGITSQEGRAEKTPYQELFPSQGKTSVPQIDNMTCQSDLRVSVLTLRPTLAFPVLTLHMSISEGNLLWLFFPLPTFFFEIATSPVMTILFLWLSMRQNAHLDHKTACRRPAQEQEPHTSTPLRSIFALDKKPQGDPFSRRAMRACISVFPPPHCYNELPCFASSPRRANGISGEVA